MGEPERELWDDYELSKFESGCDGFLAKASDVILIGVADLLDESVHAESFEQARHLAAAEFGQVGPKRFVL